jgi:hypothetical protein
MAGCTAVRGQAFLSISSAFGDEDDLSVVYLLPMYRRCIAVMTNLKRS